MNEFEVLQQSMESVPMPSTELEDRVRERLQEAIHRETVRSVEQNRRSGRLTRRTRTILTAAAMVIVLIAASVAIFTQQGSKTPTAPSWRVAGYISQPAWAQAQVGPPSGYLTCPTTQTCYVVTTGTGQSLVQVSDDGGRNWMPRSLPTGVALSTGLTCTTDLSCMGGAVVSGSSFPAILFTTDGGRDWQLKKTSISAGTVYQLTCVSSLQCSALAAPDPLNPTSSSFLTTSNGGGSWTVAHLSSAAIVQSLNCTTASFCVIGGSTAPSPGTTVGFVQTTSDGGRLWADADLPSGTAGVRGAVCPSTAQCYAIGAVPAPAVPSCPVPPSPGSTDAQCGSANGALTTEPISSGDGGHHWTALNLPSAVRDPQLFAISCPSNANCWLAGSQALESQTTSGGVPFTSGGSPLLLNTSDRGATWVQTVVSIPASVPRGAVPSAISAIDCAALETCTALGAGASSSTQGLVYAYGRH